jgi:hypothetical protein
MRTDLHALASNIDNEIVEYTRLFASEHLKRDIAYRARQRDEDLIAELSSKIEGVRTILSKLEGVYRLYNWNRAYIVPRGHVHHNRQCHTLYADTEIYPVPECSGLTEDEIVNMAADRACTVCYPSAPVEERSALMAPGEEERLQVKAEKLTKAQEKKAKEVRVSTSPSTERIFGSVRSAKTEASDEIFWALYSMVYRDVPVGDVRTRVDTFWTIATAVAAHRDSEAANVDELTNELIDKVHAKFVREGKKTADKWGMTTNEFCAKAQSAVDDLKAA